MCRVLYCVIFPVVFTALVVAFVWVNVRLLVTTHHFA